MIDESVADCSVECLFDEDAVDGLRDCVNVFALLLRTFFTGDDTSSLRSVLREIRLRVDFGFGEIFSMSSSESTITYLLDGRFDSLALARDGTFFDVDDMAALNSKSPLFGLPVALTAFSKSLRHFS